MIRVRSEAALFIVGDNKVFVKDSAKDAARVTLLVKDKDNATKEISVSVTYASV